MIGVYVGALILAGAFTLLPGRLFYEILFGLTQLSILKQDNYV
tara:strand:+ start:1096 stop:1224 length:129 start_codon:yes stop_codon:yes gene_type:complete